MAADSLGPDWARHGAGWAANDAVFDRIFAPVTDAILTAADLTGAVLDIGCGTGTLLERASDLGASAVGVDISADMIDAAARRVPQANAVVADAQTADLRALAAGEGFDRIVSRFGVMFFPDPVAAFTNIRRSTAPGASMTFMCWQDGHRNPIFTLGTSTLIKALDQKPARPEPGSPGPVAFADPDYLRGVLTDAGWSNTRIDDFSFRADYSSADSDGVEERLAVILATSTGQSVEEAVRAKLGESGWSDLLDGVRESLRAERADGILTHEGHCWLVSTRAGT
ncbi:class I SAM-dependent methyltransferase [Gordonia sp. HY002]|uniref:class I SAM-dependent methyltransferase n=1 Tax=Gordonia zhenghanii TaxID=2911516 RepID=UPI001EF00A61|nr:class I SAM-dependent methyltransferase [Gordonia zhenghanii]MCF8568961.1 class I SAM-dependent methyltransferase [Gordonia zhenghanii]MCF8603056.1 class I SAM-dependent methyltransferase [Gordonia zhenghanii]